jgi:SAM-dependent methyltransferase
MHLKETFDQWVCSAQDRYTDRQWLLSKWEVCDGVEWPKAKVEIMVRTIREALRPRQDDILADLGCGGGWIAELLRPSVREVVGLDFCRDMLNIASRAGRGPWVQGAIGELPFRENSFDRVLSYFVFLNFSDDDLVFSSIRDIYRVLKPGGTALIGQLPLMNMNAAYDAAKADYVDYCQRTMSLGPRNDNGSRVPLRSFSRERMAEFLGQQKIAFEFLSSFNPFYREGEPQTVTWRFDLLVFK